MSYRSSSSDVVHSGPKPCCFNCQRPLLLSIACSNLSTNNDFVVPCRTWNRCCCTSHKIYYHHLTYPHCSRRHRQPHRWNNKLLIHIPWEVECQYRRPSQYFSRWCRVRATAGAVTTYSLIVFGKLQLQYGSSIPQCRFLYTRIVQYNRLTEFCAKRSNVTFRHLRNCNKRAI